MSNKIKPTEIPDKISSHNIFLLQKLNKELENECIIKESKNNSLKLLIEILFNLLNSQITLIFQLSKINNSISSKRQFSNNSHLIEHMLSFNKDIMLKQIQKIISFIKDFKSKSNITNKKELNNSILNHTSYKISIKNFLKNNNKTIIIDDNNYLSKYYNGRCNTEQNENKENKKIFITDSFIDNNLNDNIYNKKSIRPLGTNKKMNIKLLNYDKNKNNNKPKNLKVLKNENSFLELNKELKEENIYFNTEEENPVRKVKNIIVNAKRNSSMNRNRTREDFTLKDLSRDNNKILNANEKVYKIHKQNSSDFNPYRHKNIYNEIINSLNDMKSKKKSKNLANNDIKINNYGNSNNKNQTKTRESMQLLHDGMKNIKNKLISKKLQKNHNK